MMRLDGAVTFEDNNASALGAGIYLNDDLYANLLVEIDRQSDK